MATDPRTLSETLLVLKDAGVLEFECPEFSVRFPAPQPEPLRTVEVVVPPAARGVVEEAPQGNYDRLFRGNKPRLGGKGPE